MNKILISFESILKDFRYLNNLNLNNLYKRNLFKI